jgi:dTDP-4-dehydrorhamnose reductase
MKVVIVGAKGQLGVDLCSSLFLRDNSVIQLTHDDVDVSDSDQVERVIGSTRADVVISTAAFHKVEQCETQPEPSFAVNAIGPWNLANTCRRMNAVLVHFSTDYVFDGHSRQPYNELDLPGPLNVYGVSKLAGEGMVALTWKRSFIVRTCGLYGLAGSRGRGGNFVEAMLKKTADNAPIRVVYDQVLTPTFTTDLAEAIRKLINTENYGLYHISAEGQCSWFEFARRIFEIEAIQPNLTPVSTAQFSSTVKRPAYSVLAKRKLQSLGIHMPYWEDGLRRYLALRRGQKGLHWPIYSQEG